MAILVLITIFTLYAVHAVILWDIYARCRDSRFWIWLFATGVPIGVITNALFPAAQFTVAQNVFLLVMFALLSFSAAFPLHRAKKVTYSGREEN